MAAGVALSLIVLTAFAVAGRILDRRDRRDRHDRSG